MVAVSGLDRDDAMLLRAQDLIMKAFNYCGFDAPIQLAEMTGGGPDTFEHTSMFHLTNLKRFLQFQSRIPHF